MAFNLPPPWDPGFALPSNVRDEGLERRAFVTRQAPRGTYDDPSVGTGGYAVPGYVLKEGYGQGAYGTKWAPRGRYDIPVPNRLNQRPKTPVLIKEGSQQVIGGSTGSNLGGTKLPTVYESFGAKAAAAMIQPVLAAEPSERKNILKRIMDAIDPTLWTRTAALADQYAKAGHSAMAALQAGLARALATGAAREVVAAGQTGQTPTSGLMGLGCACAQGGLGATVSGSLLDKLGGLKNIAAAVLEPPPKLQVGPFLLDLTPGSVAKFQWSKTTPEQRQAVLKGMAMASVKDMMRNMNGNPGIPPGWVKLGTIIPGGGSSWISPSITKSPQLTFHFKHPTDGKRYGVFVKVATGSDPTLEVSFKYDPTFLQSVWNGIMELVAAIVYIAKEVISVVGGLACQLAQSPNATQAGAAIGVAAGAGAATGAAGAEVVKGACYTPPPAPPVAPPASSSPILPLAIAGGAVAAVYFATRKK
jgi:hypothetical protein